MEGNAGSLLGWLLVAAVAAGFFVVAGRRRAGRGSEVESRSAAYLSSAPPGPRKDVLAAVCINRVAALPIAAADEFGEPVTDAHGLRSAADVVRAVLRQDDSMYAWVARTALIMLDRELAAAARPWRDLLTVATASVGFSDVVGLRADLRERLPPEVRERVEALHDYVLGIFWVVAQPQLGGDRDRMLYRHLFESSDPRTRLSAFDITAYTGVIIGRLRNRRVLGPSRFSDGDYRVVPPMPGAGWYPNPYNHGDLQDGLPDFERYWDGQDWTDRIRQWAGGRSTESIHDLRTMPSN